MEPVSHGRIGLPSQVARHTKAANVAIIGDEPVPAEAKPAFHPDNWIEQIRLPRKALADILAGRHREVGRDPRVTEPTEQVEAPVIMGHHSVGDGGLGDQTIGFEFGSEVQRT